jgi:hypothetical protein
MKHGFVEVGTIGSGGCACAATFFLLALAYQSISIAIFLFYN